MWPDSRRATLTHLPLVARACVLTLGRHPSGLNAVQRAGRAGQQEPVNLGFVVGMDEGQVVAVLHGAEQMSMRTLLARCDELVGRARAGRLAAEERSSDSFRICDLAAYGVTRGNIRVTPPMVAGLGLGSVSEQFVPDQSGQPVLRPQMTLTLSLASGPGAPSETEGARFLARPVAQRWNSHCACYCEEGMMRIAIGCDDAGAPLLEALGEYLQASAGVVLEDLSAPASNREEYYPDVAERVANAVAAGRCERGLLVCGTGIGMSITCQQGARHPCGALPRYLLRRPRPREQRRANPYDGRARDWARAGQGHRGDLAAVRVRREQPVGAKSSAHEGD